MNKFISRIEDTFQITGRGCVVIPGLPKSRSDLRVKVGDQVVLKRSDGTQLNTVVRGVQMGGSLEVDFIPLLLGEEISKEMVPVGTELWVK